MVIAFSEVHEADIEADADDSRREFGGLVQIEKGLLPLAAAHLDDA